MKWQIFESLYKVFQKTYGNKELKTREHIIIHNIKNNEGQNHKVTDTKIQYRGNIHNIKETIYKISPGKFITFCSGTTNHTNYEYHNEVYYGNIESAIKYLESKCGIMKYLEALENHRKNNTLF